MASHATTFERYSPAGRSPCITSQHLLIDDILFSTRSHGSCCYFFRSLVFFSCIEECFYWVFGIMGLLYLHQYTHWQQTNSRLISFSLYTIEQTLFTPISVSFQFCHSCSSANIPRSQCVPSSRHTLAISICLYIPHFAADVKPQYRNTCLVHSNSLSCSTAGQ